MTRSKFPLDEEALRRLAAILEDTGLTEIEVEAGDHRMRGAKAPGLSPNTIGRLKSAWVDELEQWRTRDLSGKRYVYWWADGIYCKVRMEKAKIGRAHV